MSLQALPRRRVASPDHRSRPSEINRFSVAPPYLWLNLSPETQTQIARILAGAVAADAAGRCRRWQGRMGHVLIAARASADERVIYSTAHRAKLAYVYVRRNRP